MEKKLSVLTQTATALGRSDEVPNQDLAKKIASKNDKAGVQELVENLSNKSKDIQHDCIKVLYEIGLLKPALIIPYTKDLLPLLKSKNNRMQWGGMTALNAIATGDPDLIYSHLPKLIEAADKGSVITRDHFVAILIKFATNKKYSANALELICEQLLTAPANQVPMYAENALPVIDEKHKKKFSEVLRSRLGDFEKESKRKRVEKVILKIKN